MNFLHTSQNHNTGQNLVEWTEMGGIGRNELEFRTR